MAVRILGHFLALTAGFAVLNGCKASGVKPKSADAAAAAILTPRRVETAAGQPDETKPTLVDIDDRGKLKANLVLRLDYFPAGRPGQATLPACFAALPAEMEVGFAVCTKANSERYPIRASHVIQACYTNPTVKRTPAAVNFQLQGCSQAAVYAYRFEPELRIDSEGR